MSLYERIHGRAGLTKLLRHFYADVRQHKVIGPIFNQRISNWPEHLEIIGQFWTRQTGGPSNYNASGMLKHLHLSLQPEHFAFWLELWEFNCRRYLPATEADELNALAHQFGNHLQKMIKRRALEIRPERP